MAALGPQKVGEGRTGVAFNPEIMAAPVGCTNAVCGLVIAVETLEKLVAKKKQYIVTCDVAEENYVKVATLLSVEVGQLVVVALLGSLVGDSVVGAKDVGGHTTTGRLCDVAMMGWKGDSKSVATLPKTFAPGDSAPEEAPKGGVREVQVDKLGNIIGNLELEELSAKPKVSKEDKKIAALEAKAARDAKKKAAKGEGAAESTGPRKPSKLELAKIKKDVKTKRAAGEEVYTDDELEAAGFIAE
jgi:hypothetical protein